MADNPDLTVQIEAIIKRTPSGAFTLKHTFVILNKEGVFIAVEKYNEILMGFLVQFGHIAAADLEEEKEKRNEIE